MLNLGGRYRRLLIQVSPTRFETVTSVRTPCCNVPRCASFMPRPSKTAWKIRSFFYVVTRMRKHDKLLAAKPAQEIWGLGKACVSLALLVPSLRCAPPLGRVPFCFVHLDRYTNNAL